MEKIILIYVPCKDISEAKCIADALVSRKLAFCTNIIPRIHSIYPWKGNIERTDESLLLVKTIVSLKQKTIARILSVHSYSTPEILVFDVADTTKAIGEWIRTELKK